MNAVLYGSGENGSFHVSIAAQSKKGVYIMRTSKDLIRSITQSVQVLCCPLVFSK